MPEKVRIPLAVGEITVYFRSPRIDLIGSAMSATVERIAEAWGPFGFRVADLEVMSAGSPADHSVSFRLPAEGVNLQFGAEKYVYRKEQVSWAGAERDFGPLRAAESLLLADKPESAGACVVRVGMHLQSETSTPHQLLAPLLPPTLSGLLGGQMPSRFGNHLLWDHGELLVDFSMAFANAIFVRFSTNFEVKPEFGEMMSEVRKNQTAVMTALGIEEIYGD